MLMVALAALAAQPVAVPTGPTEPFCLTCSGTGETTGKVSPPTWRPCITCDGTGGEVPDRLRALDERIRTLRSAPASRDSTPAIEPCDKCGTTNGGPLCDGECFLCRNPDALAVSRDSTKGTAPAKTCWAWCGFNCQHPDICGKKVHFCTKACAAAGKPLHPTPPSTRGTCGTCLWSRQVLHVYDRGPGDAPGNQMGPCPDCAPKSEVSK